MTDTENKEPQESTAAEHDFVKQPNKTLLILATPVLFSMIAEPLTGLVDTSFVSRLGAEALAALGVGTITLTSAFWIFNFLAIGSQSEIAQLWGKQERKRSTEVAGLVLSLAIIIGIVIILVGIPFAETAAKLMGAENGILTNAVDYMRIRLLAAPAILASLAGFGILRGIQDMKTPMKVAILINALNIVMDPILIFGFDSLFIPALGIKGAALATLISQYIGAVAVFYVVYKRFGVPEKLNLSDAVSLFKIGGDLFIRTGLLLTFLLLTTREATRLGADGGAAHQAIRQIWMFSALFLDSFAITGQSLIGYFVGAEKLSTARKVAVYVMGWSVVTGLVLSVSMLAGTGLVEKLLVPDSALSLFETAWIAAAAVQPINALAFATDGIHWGTKDFSFLRNVMILATGVGATLLLTVHVTIFDALTTIWCVTAVWIFIRAFFGIVRVFPGLGQSPLKSLPQAN